MGLTGLEPVTLRLSSACSNQLSYRPEEKCLTPVRVRLRPVVLDCRRLRQADFAEQNLEVRGLEPLTYSLQSYRSTS
jgi:hypothetical protein